MTDKCYLIKDKNNWNGGLAPCVGCERECPITAGMTELTFDDGYEQAMIDCGDAVETSYLDGYKDCFCGKPPVVEDEELSKVLSEQQSIPKSCRFSNNYEKDAVEDLYVSGKILCMVEDAKKSLFEVRKKIYTSDINNEEQRTLAIKILKVVELLDNVQQQYTADEMYRFLGYME